MYTAHAVLMAVISFVYNILYWCVHWREWDATVDVMEAEAQRLETIYDVKRLMLTFVWTSDGFLDWQPWIETMFSRRFNDDCDGAAVLGKWALEKIGVESRIVRLWKTGSRFGHSVCISNDNKYMVSNDEVHMLDGDFPQNVYSRFGNDFNVMT